MNYTAAECDIITVDGMEELAYKHKRAFLHAMGDDEPARAKYEQILIKSLGNGVYNKMKALFSDGDFRRRAVQSLEDSGVSCVVLGGEGYPSALAHTDAPPLALYCRGRRELLSTQCFAVVGSRRTPAATMAACKKISGQIAARMTVVTGVADGADTAAIEGALESGNIICVFPGGLDYVYSAPNAKLLRQVEERGLIISEWQPKTAIMRYMFSVRNRIIAGLSRGVLVASAPKKSGALITAGYAADYGREVFAFPHSLGISAGEGSNALIQNGAMLCKNVLDIFDSFGLEYKTETTKLTPQEEAVLAFLRTNGEAHIQVVAQAAGIKVFQAVTILSSLEIKGLAVRCGGNRYSAV